MTQGSPGQDYLPVSQGLQSVFPFKVSAGGGRAAGTVTVGKTSSPWMTVQGKSYFFQS
jgi:hypothetical protein